LIKHQDGGLLEYSLASLTTNPEEQKYLENRASNKHYKYLADKNNVTDFKSFLNELYFRWKSKPGLGGKKEKPDFWDYLNTSISPLPKFTIFENTPRAINKKFPAQLYGKDNMED
jgi:hypothetical protein